jgi:hypothetical protein
LSTPFEELRSILGEKYQFLARNTNRWTDDEKETLRQLLMANRSPNEIACELGRSVSAVYAKSHELGLPTAQAGVKKRSLSSGDK